LQDSGLVGLEARDAGGAVFGRIVQEITDEASGELTHALVETEEGDEMEVPISDLTIDPEADYATFHADASDEGPGDHVDDVERPQGYAPSQGDVDDAEHDGQFVAEPVDPDEAISPEEAQREADEAGGWQDEDSTSADSGYPRNDAYIDPDTGHVEVDPALKDNETLADDVEDLIDGTDLAVRAARDGVVELSGSIPSQGDLEAAIAEIMTLDGVLEVDTTDVDVS
jgi:hypothetical protein